MTIWKWLEKMTVPKTPTCLDYYRRSHAGYTKVINACEREGCVPDLEQAHLAKSDFVLWLEAIASRREARILELAVYEYRFSILCLVQGFYRHAFSSLRLFVELSLAMIQMSANELQLRQWLTGNTDIYWNSIINEKTGIFSPDFVKAFCPELIKEAKHMEKNAGALYRECSEFVHGKLFTYRDLAEEIEFSKEAFSSWISKATTARYLVHYCLAVRYSEELSKAEILKVEKMLQKELGHITEFSQLVSAKVK